MSLVPSGSSHCRARALFTSTVSETPLALFPSEASRSIASGLMEPTWVSLAPREGSHDVPDAHVMPE
eukprot:3868840-Alexandrium_andersonii.AAC.1